MLEDGARKVLTVLWNTYRNEAAEIDLPYLCQRSQRTERQVKEAVNLLVKEGYLIWDKASHKIRVLYHREEEKAARGPITFERF